MRTIRTIDPLATALVSAGLAEFVDTGYLGPATANPNAPGAFTRNSYQGAADNPGTGADIEPAAWTDEQTFRLWANRQWVQIFLDGKEVKPGAGPAALYVTRNGVIVRA